jgi:hypothetical protein
METNTPSVTMCRREGAPAPVSPSNKLIYQSDLFPGELRAQRTQCKGGKQ